MYQAFNESTGAWTESFFYEEELIAHLTGISSERDFWDVYKDGRLVYYWS